MKYINSDQHTNISTCPENTIKKLHVCDWYEPMMSRWADEELYRYLLCSSVCES